MEIFTDKAKLGKAIIAGDFNSNSFWDKVNRWWNHSDVVRELSEMKIESLYHQYFKGEAQGKEFHPTFFLHKNITKPYHVDYIFASKEFNQSIKEFSVGKPARWLSLSDHMPVCCEI